MTQDAIPQIPPGADPAIYNMEDDGALRVGDRAPDFTLEQLTRKEEKAAPTHLASFQGKRPVVIFFGSYT